jgi:2-(1,2-epoxy-1,2-dihydrophenyl)acetyl-CoA isomerase
VAVSASDGATVLVEDRGAVRVITLNRPHVRNAIDLPLRHALAEAVEAADATFATTFTGVGLAGDMGIFASLPARVGAPRARQMLMLGTKVSGAEAGSTGLVDRVVDPGTALAAALEDAARLAAGPPLALGVIKRMLSGEPRHPLAVLDLEVRNQTMLWDSDDFAEGVSAFADKRRPVFGERPPLESR